MQNVAEVDEIRKKRLNKQIMQAIWTNPRIIIFNKMLVICFCCCCFLIKTI